MNKLEKISIVGGGTAGFTSALILKTRFPHIEVEVIRSKKIGIIGVGEGSTEHWNEFMKYINIPFQAVIRHCDATFKCGIMFKGWGNKDYMHSIGPENDIKNGQYPTVYGKLLSDGSPNHTFNPSLTWKNEVYTNHLDPDSGSPFNQYHFNTNKLNDFLTKIAEIRGINIIDDEILDIELNELGEISKLVGELNTYSSDFYIDCTGFKKFLISKLGATWKSHAKYLKMKSAIVFPTEEKEEYNMWTTAQAMDYGWMFNIPVWGRCGNGYIFDSDYITADQAKLEVEKFLGKEITVGKHINFDPGHLDRVWIKNCCAIGLSANFIEPLEATSIGTSIQQAFLLMHRLPNYTEKTIEKYNNDVNDIMINIRDFVILHYITNKTNTQFWKDVSQMEIPESLKEKLKQWRTNLPIADDFNSQTAYVLFRDAHYLQILAGLDLFDREKIKQEYEMMHHDIKNIAEKFIRETRTFEKMNPSIGHKEFISRIRNKQI
jgi:tryptophan halogenase